MSPRSALSTRGVARSRRLASVLVFATVAGGAGACHPPVQGQSCDEPGRGSCIDGARALRCRDYSWHVDPCRGAAGCKAHADKTAVTCDASIADEGDACGQRGATACTTQRDGLLSCDGRAFVRVSSCRGPDACVPGETGASCDTRSAREGDPCVDPMTAPLAARAVISAPAFAVEGGSRAGLPRGAPHGGAASCAHDFDGDAELVCTDGVYVLHARCRGPRGCAITGEGVVCDDSAAEVGDPCHANWPACSVNGRSALSCTDGLNGRYVRFATCGGPSGCVRSLPVGAFECDQTRAEVGDPCGPIGVEACSPDGKHLLACGGHDGRSCGRRGGMHRFLASAPSGHVSSGVMAAVDDCKHHCQITETREGARVETAVDCK